jgi:hypothetical protein
MPTRKPDIEKMRPKGRRGEKRTTQIHVRLTEGEKKQLEALAGEHGADLSEYLRAKALNVTPRQSGKATGDRALLLQTLGSLGKGLNNINQIARAINRGEAESWDTISQAIQELRLLGQQLRDILTYGHTRTGAE